MVYVQIYSSPAHLPFSFARHFWFVIHDGAEKKRYEVLFYGNKEKKLGHMHIDEFLYDVGLGIFPLLKGYTWKGTLEKTYTSTQAEQLKNIIETSITEYPFLDAYKLTGPNSNTYVQWIFDQVEIDFHMPWNAIGKNFSA